MLTKRRSHFGRSGISTLVGAIFFVLVVFLVFSSTVLIFETFTNYATTFKQVNQQDLQNKATSLAISQVAFGGVVATSESVTVPTVLGGLTAPLFKPVQNMNFTSSMEGWTFSRGYDLSLHTGTLYNSPENVLPGLDIYSLTVANNDSLTPPAPPGVTSYIVQVEISVNPNFLAPESLQLAPNANWASPTCTLVPGTYDCSSISWSTSCTNGIFSSPVGNTQTFDWPAVAPSVTGSYVQTVTVTWEDFVSGGCSPVKASGLAPITINVVTTSPGGRSVAKITPVALGTVPGGAFGGYDPTSANIGSDSGPGSLYMTYGPSLSGQPLTSGKQLTAEMNFTTDFNLNATLSLAAESHCATAPVGCPSLSLGYSLDNLISNSSQILLSAYLTDLSAAGQPVKNIINSTVVNELNGQNVSQTGWQMKDYHFGLVGSKLESVTNELPAGLYALTISLTVTLFGATPPSTDYPASMLMHFDDVGLSLPEAPAVSYCADTAASGAQPCAVVCSPAASCPIYLIAQGSEPEQVQSLRLSAQISAVNPDSQTTAYAYIEDIGASASAATWVELGQVTFNSSATISAVIPASTAPNYMDEVGTVCQSHLPGEFSLCLRIYAVQSGNPSPLNVVLSLGIQTWQQTVSTIYVGNNGTAPIHVVSLYVSGPGVLYSDTAVNTWVSQGETLPFLIGAQAGSLLPTFVWSTGQTYVVTLVTDKGLEITGTYVSP